MSNERNLPKGWTEEQILDACVKVLIQPDVDEEWVAREDADFKAKGYVLAMNFSRTSPQGHQVTVRVAPENSATEPKTAGTVIDTGTLLVPSFKVECECFVVLKIQGETYRRDIPQKYAVPLGLLLMGRVRSQLMAELN